MLADDYRDAKFSTYYNFKLSLAPIQMGLSIGIPHSKDSGHLLAARGLGI
jgi:hypothetical protein